MNEETNKTSKFDELVDIIALSNSPETEGFDIQAGETWIYPTNYTLREYQYNIIQEALLNNTMVSLPTGLGKTFIAAVVMYNFYRWYPSGKIIFMAPSRPLVKQQIDACYNIMAIPKEVTAELTGAKGQTYRKEIWKEKRVFFITPQVLQNDLGILTELGTKIKCIVFDEAHKAKGNYAYCEVIRKLSPQNKYFRVLALSATPGSSFNDVSDVINNLLISRLEIRTDESPDVTPYVFPRTLESIVVPLGEKLQQVRDDYMQILEKYTRLLVQYRVITGNCSTLTKGKIFMTMKDFQEKNRNGRDRAYSDIMRNLNICVTLYHAYELLTRHGLRGFLSFFEEHADKPLLRGNMELQHIMQDVREYLGPAPTVEPLPDGSILEIPESSKFGHPKFYKLNEILLNHFKKTGNGTASRAIVFCEYRESVMEAYALLLRQKPLVRPRIFLGQGAITQKQQIKVIKAFKDGECNTLISTSIGEEGLDIGEVDLIVCFDISNKSPVRMVQRMGRTGRQREGRVVVLVTEGKEQQTLKECLIQKQNFTNHVLQSSALHKQMYAQNPRMVPADVTPQCQKMHITVTTNSNPPSPRKKSKNLKDMFDTISSKKNSIMGSQDFTIEVVQIDDRLPVTQTHWNKGNPLNISNDETRIDFSKKIGKLRTLQPTGKYGHTKNSELLVSLLQFAESKKYNIPMTQVPVMPSQMQKSTKMVKVPSSNSLKQADIRNMFSKPPSNTELTSSNKDVKMVQEEQNHFCKQTLNLLYAEISSYLTITISDQTKCKICENLFNCSVIPVNTKEFDIKTWVEPDFSIFNSLTAENLTMYTDSLNSKTEEILKVVVNNDKNTYTKEICMVNSNNNLDNTYGNHMTEGNFEDSLKQSPFKPPRNIGTVLEKVVTPLNLNNSLFNNIAFTQIENTTSKHIPKATHLKENETCDDRILCSLNVNAFEEAEFTQIKSKTRNKTNHSKYNNQTLQNTLSFFNITALEEIFGNSCQESPLKTAKSAQLPTSTPQTEKSLSDSQDTIIYSPNDCAESGKKKNLVKVEGGSPILCSYERVHHLKNKAQKRLFEKSLQSCTNSLTQAHLCSKYKTGEIKNVSADIVSESENSIIEKTETINSHKPNLSNLLCKGDTRGPSFFKSKQESSHQLISKMTEINEENDSDLDIIDTSLENCLESIASTQQLRKEKKHVKDKLETNSPFKQNQQNQKPKESVFNVSDIIDLSIFGLDSIIPGDVNQTDQISKGIDNNTISDNNRSVKRNIVAGKSQIEETIENSSTVKKSARDCVSDFCDATFIDMFLDCNFDGGESITKNIDCKKESIEIKVNTNSSSNSKSTSYDEPQNTIKNIISKNKIDGPSSLLSSTPIIKSKITCNEKNSKSYKYDNTTLNQNVQVLKEFRPNDRSKEKSEWNEESIWDFCLNWTKNEGASTKEEINIPTNNNTSVFSLGVTQQKKEEIKNCTDQQLTSQIGKNIKLNQNDLVTKQSPKKQGKSPEVVDLTEDSPIKDTISPTLIKSQRSTTSTPLKSHQSKKISTQKLSYPVFTSQNQIGRNALSGEQKKNSNSKSTKTKLQLNSKEAQHSITSMDWFKKSETNPPCSSKIPVTPTKQVTSHTLASQRSPFSKLKLNCFEEEYDMDESFGCTFNYKKSVVNLSQKPSLPSKLPLVGNSNKTALKSSTTPKKSKSQENPRIINVSHNLNKLDKVFESVDDSDDDFELPRKATGWVGTRRNIILEGSKSPSAKNKKMTLTNKGGESAARIKTNSKKKLEHCPYIDLEAEMSMDEYASSDTDHEETDADDKFEESFVDDETQNIANNTTIHAHYMQSVRSPLLNKGKFKIPKIPPPAINVYSQQVDEAENSYVNDTFCINTEEMELSQETKAHDMSELELAELMLEQQRIQKKRRKKSDDKSGRKRRRILECTNDSD